MNGLRLLHPYVRELALEKKDYRKEVQVFYEFFDVLIERERGHNKKKWEMIRDTVCLGFEYDPSYLLRVLDAYEEIKERGLLDNLKIEASTEILKGLAYDFKKLTAEKYGKENDQKSNQENDKGRNRADS